MTVFDSMDDYAVPALSTAEIAERAESFLSRVDPLHLRGARPLNIERLLDHALALEGIDAYAVLPSELPGSEAETVVGDDGRVHILIRERIYDAALRRDVRAHRARSTICHEIGHAVLHGLLLRKHRDGDRAALRRVAPAQVAAFRSAEWQAFAFGSTLLVPLTALRAMTERSPRVVSSSFLVSAALAEKHLRRLATLLAEPQGGA